MISRGFFASVARMLTFVVNICLVMSLAAAAAAQTPAAPGGEAAATSIDQVYRLGPGDKLRITVFNEPDLSGEYEVDGSGNLSLKLIGAVPAVGSTLPDLAGLIETRLRDGYLLNPKVAIDVLNYRPFYVLGEVNSPGSYPFVAGMTVLKAIALAGGFTYRARESKIELIRASAPDKKIMVDPETLIMPGDILRVKERFF